jgi:hypothetical protein
VSPVLPELLERLPALNEEAPNEPVAELYNDLHPVASRHLLGERTGCTLECGFNDRAHFLSVASRVMRHLED